MHFSVQLDPWNRGVTSSKAPTETGSGQCYLRMWVAQGGSWLRLNVVCCGRRASQCLSCLAESAALILSKRAGLIKGPHVKRHACEECLLHRGVVEERCTGVKEAPPSMSYVLVTLLVVNRLRNSSDAQIFSQANKQTNIAIYIVCGKIL